MGGEGARVFITGWDADELGEHPELTLHARFDDGTPSVTAAEFARFIGAWARNDPNGTWNPDGVVEGDGALIYVDECGKTVWPVVGVDDAGLALYALVGWPWTWVIPAAR